MGGNWLLITNKLKDIEKEIERLSEENPKNQTFKRSDFKDGFIESDLSKQPFGIEIGFTTDDVARTFAGALAAGALLLEEPKTKPWGQVVAYVRDLDGFLIEICSEMN